jgi:hypothetical protein
VDSSPVRPARHRPTAARVHELLEYDPFTGLFRWRVDRLNVKKVAGDVAGSVSKKLGYVIIGVDGRTYYGHILAWFMTTGEWPEGEIDHENLNRSDNRWDNLRRATKSQQRANQHVRADSKIGVKGVYLTPKGRYGARIASKKLGVFDTIEEASAAYAAAAERRFGDYARGA